MKENIHNSVQLQVEIETENDIKWTPTQWAGSVARYSPHSTSAAPSLQATLARRVAMVQTWFRPGSDLAQTWFRPGSDLAQTWLRPGSDLVYLHFIDSFDMFCTLGRPGCDSPQSTVWLKNKQNTWTKAKYQIMQTETLRCALLVLNCPVEVRSRCPCDNRYRH